MFISSFQISVNFWPLCEIGVGCSVSFECVNYILNRFFGPMNKSRNRENSKKCKSLDYVFSKPYLQKLTFTQTI